MKNDSFKIFSSAALVAALVGSALAQEAPLPAAAAAAPVAADLSSVVAAPGANPRTMTPEMEAYVKRLEAIRVERDAQAQAVAEADAKIEARKAVLIAESEELNALVKRAAELEDELAQIEEKISAAWASDESISSLQSVRAAAETKRDEKQAELLSSVAAAMQERAEKAKQASLPQPETPEAK